MAEEWRETTGRRGGGVAPAGGRRAPSPDPGGTGATGEDDATARNADTDADMGVDMGPWGTDTEEGEEVAPPAARPRHRSRTRERPEKLGVRITGAERARLRDLAIAADLGFSEYVRGRLLGETSGPGPAAGGVDEALYEELRAYQRDIHSLLNFVQQNTPGLIHTDVATLEKGLMRQAGLTEELVLSLRAWQGRDAHLDVQIGDLGDQLAAVSRKLDGVQRIGTALHALAKPDDRLDEVLRLLRGVARRQGPPRTHQPVTGDE